MSEYGHCRARLLSALCLLGLVLAVGFTSVVPAHSQNLSNVGVVDIQKITRESLAAQSVLSEMEGRQASYRDQLKAKEDDLRAQFEELQRQKTILSPEAFSTREAEFNKKREQLQREAAAKRQELDDGLNYAMQQIRAEMSKIIQNIADERGYTMVMERSLLVVSGPDLDFSAEVLARLNQILPSVATSPTQ